MSHSRWWSSAPASRKKTHLKPKPMIEIGGKPILWHIMKIYSHHGINDFIVCCGYKGYLIKEYFANYFLHMSDVTFDMLNNKMEFTRTMPSPGRSRSWIRATSTMTGGARVSGGSLGR